MAATFHSRLTAICKKLQANDHGGGYGASSAIDGRIETAAGDAATADIIRSKFHYLLTLPEDLTSPRAQFSISLLEMLCQPFGDPSHKASAEVNVKEPAVWQKDPTRYEYPQMIQHLEWDFESHAPFQWDFGQIGVSCADGTASLPEASLDEPMPKTDGAWNRFLGSQQPSGWSNVERLDNGKRLRRG